MLNTVHCIVHASALTPREGTVQVIVQRSSVYIDQRLAIHMYSQLV